MAVWHEIGAIGLCKEDEMHEFEVANQVVLIWCHNGEYHAAQGLCPHMHGHLAKGKLEGTVVTCPRHGSRFDLLTGENLAWVSTLQGAARALVVVGHKPAALVLYPVKVIDKRVMVQF
jgi:3-phenylpropionate/trans-cinnamate dioxygenase ferredoxin component